jgi:hypothetical protein
VRESLEGIDLEDIGYGEALAAVAEELYSDRCGRGMAADYLGIESHEPETEPA